MRIVKLESNTIGNIQNPSADDVLRAFDDEWADVAGNIYALYRDNNKSIHSISGMNFRNYSLSLGDGGRTFLLCNSHFNFRHDQIQDYFVRFYKNDDTWISELKWIKQQQPSLFGFVKNLFRKL